MRKSLIIAAAAALFVIAGCSSKTDDGLTVRKVIVTPDEVSLPEGLTESLSVTVEPSTASYTIITWTSSDTKVATISKKGTLTAVSAGEATITATVNGVSGTCDVTVTRNTTAVTGIKLSAENLKVGIGSSEALIATVTPSDAANRKVTWSSSNPAIATVEDGLVTGIALGECDVTATTEDGGLKASCHVTVEETPIEAISFTNGSENTIMVDPGTTQTLIVGFNPANASNKNLKWTTSDASIATVESAGEGQGKVTFSSTKYGAVEITATTEKDSRTAVQSFFVKGSQPLYTAPSGKIYAGKKAHYVFNTAFYTNAKNIKWSTGNKTVEGAEVDLAVDGGGEQTIVVSAQFGNITISADFTVNATEWFMNQPLDGVNPRNTRPVFNKEQTRAYFVTRGARRLYEVNLETGSIGWIADINADKADNGGQIAVNPVTGDIYCANQNYFFSFDKNGAKKWELGLSSSAASTAIGSAVAVSNEGDIAFFAGSDKRIWAIDANTGAMVDTVKLKTMEHTQMAVYGDNNLVIGTSQGTTAGHVYFISFSGGKFGEPTVCENVIATDYTDICSLAIDKDQNYAYFGCNKAGLVKADLKNKTAQGFITGNTWGYLSGPCFAPNGLLLFAAQIPASVYAINPGTDLGTTANYMRLFTGHENHTLNFTHVCTDTDSNVYFFIRDDGEGNNAFYKGQYSDGTYEMVKIASIEKQNNDPQAFFGFGGGCLIGGGGSNSTNRLLIRCVDAERAKGWSGGGGDACGSNNANFAWGN